MYTAKGPNPPFITCRQAGWLVFCFIGTVFAVLLTYYRTKYSTEKEKNFNMWFGIGETVSISVSFFAPCITKMIYSFCSTDCCCAQCELALKRNCCQCCARSHIISFGGFLVSVVLLGFDLSKHRSPWTDTDGQLDLFFVVALALRSIPWLLFGVCKLLDNCGCCGKSHKTCQPTDIDLEPSFSFVNIPDVPLLGMNDNSEV